MLNTFGYNLTIQKAKIHLGFTTKQSEQFLIMIMGMSDLRWETRTKKGSFFIFKDFKDNWYRDLFWNSSNSFILIVSFACLACPNLSSYVAKNFFGLPCIAFSSRNVPQSFASPLSQLMVICCYLLIDIGSSRLVSACKRISRCW